MLVKYKVPKFPRVVRVEPAASCNLKCRHCPTGTVKMERGIMSEKTFSLVLDNIKQNLDFIKVIVLYHGGEPLLNKKFIQFFKELKELKIPFIKTVSNGNLLSMEYIKEIVDNQLDMIEFSLDCQNPKDNDYIRQNCDYDQVVKMIKALITYKKEVNSKLPEIAIASTQFINKEITSLDEIQSEDIPIPNYLLKEFEKEYQNKDIEFKMCYAMIWPDMVVDQSIFEIKEFFGDSKNYCDHVINTVTIRWNGDVIPCCYDLTSKYVIGNIYEESLSSIWNNQKFQVIRKSIEEKDFIDLCKKCAFINSYKYLVFKKSDENIN